MQGSSVTHKECFDHVLFFNSYKQSKLIQYPRLTFITVWQELQGVENVITSHLEGESKRELSSMIFSPKFI